MKIEAVAVSYTHGNSELKMYVVVLFTNMLFYNMTLTSFIQHSFNN